MKGFGNRLREVRLSQNVTQENLALKSGIAVSSVVRIETGQLNASITLISKLADGLGVEKSELMKF